MTDDRETQDVEARLRASLNAYADVVGEAPARRPGGDRAGRRPSTARYRRAPMLAAAAVLAVTGGVLFVSGPAGESGRVAAPESITSEGSADAAPEEQRSAEDDSAAAAAAVPGGEPSVPSPAEVGVPYPFDLYTHCGIYGADVGGAWFAADPPLVEAGGNPPAGWGNPDQRGTLTLESADEAVFRDDLGHELRLRAAPESERPPPCD